MTERECYQAIDRFGDDRFKDGITVCLREMERIVGWLTRLPDTKRQAETRMWVQERIDALKKEHGL